MSIKARVNPHNDLFNLANYQLEVINSKIKEKEEDALSLDCLACLISLAFAIESLLNFVGYKKIEDWEENNIERKEYREKIKLICKPFGFDLGKEPFSTLWELKKIRDSVAHGKSFIEETSAKSTEEMKQAMACPWDKNLNPDYVNTMYKTVKQFKSDLLERADISLGDSVTSASGTLS